MDKLTENLRRMDECIEEGRANDIGGVGIHVSSKEEADELMEKLIERGIYTSIDSSWTWSFDMGHSYTVCVLWEEPVRI